MIPNTLFLHCFGHRLNLWVHLTFQSILSSETCCRLKTGGCKWFCCMRDIDLLWTRCLCFGSGQVLYSIMGWFGGCQRCLPAVVVGWFAGLICVMQSSHCGPCSSYIDLFGHEHHDLVWSCASYNDRIWSHALCGFGPVHLLKTLFALSVSYTVMVFVYHTLTPCGSTGLFEVINLYHVDLIWGQGLELSCVSMYKGYIEVRV